MDIVCSIEKTLFVTKALIKQNILVDEVKSLHQSLESLKAKWTRKEIDEQSAAISLAQLQKEVLKQLPVKDLNIKAITEQAAPDKIDAMLTLVYDLLHGEKAGGKRMKKPGNILLQLTGVLLSGVSRLFEHSMIKSQPAKNFSGDRDFDLSELLKGISGNEMEQKSKPPLKEEIMPAPQEHHSQKAKPPTFEMAGSEATYIAVPAESSAAPPLAKPDENVLPAKGKILYDIPDNMQVTRQAKCVVRIAKDKSTVKDDDTFTDAVKVEDILLAGVMKVELIDIAEQPRFNIKTVSSAEQEVDAESYTEWLFWVTPLVSGFHDLILKVSIIKTVNGKERRKDLVFEKEINIASADEGMPMGNQLVANTTADTTNNDMKNLADERNVTVIDPPAVFISYAHKDKVYFDIFSENLRSQSGWNIWMDRNIEIGANWFNDIQNAIKDSDFAVLLVSADFVSSGFIKQNEFAEFVGLEKSKQVFAYLPVLLRDVDFTRWKDLAALQFFVAYGDEYGVPEMKSKMIPFAKLCRFDNNNTLIPNDNIDTYFKNFVLKVEKDWLRNRRN